MRSDGSGRSNALRFDAEDLALYLASGEAKAAASATEAMQLPFHVALERSVRLQHLHQKQLDALKKNRS